MPGWKSAAWARLDRLIEKVVPGVAKAVKWNSPFYGAAGQGEASAHWFLSIHCFDKYIKVAFFRGQSLDPVPPVARSEERRVGKECVSTGSARWTRDH